MILLVLGLANRGKTQ